MDDMVEVVETGSEGEVRASGNSVFASDVYDLKRLALCSVSFSPAILLCSFDSRSLHKVVPAAFWLCKNHRNPLPWRKISAAASLSALNAPERVSNQSESIGCSLG